VINQWKPPFIEWHPSFGVNLPRLPFQRCQKDGTQFLQGYCAGCGLVAERFVPLVSTNAGEMAPIFSGGTDGQKWANHSSHIHRGDESSEFLAWYSKKPRLELRYRTSRAPIILLWLLWFHKHKPGWRISGDRHAHDAKKHLAIFDRSKKHERSRVPLGMSSSSQIPGFTIEPQDGPFAYSRAWELFTVGASSFPSTSHLRYQCWFGWLDKLIERQWTKTRKRTELIWSQGKPPLPVFEVARRLELRVSPS